MHWRVFAAVIILHPSSTHPSDQRLQLSPCKPSQNPSIFLFAVFCKWNRFLQRKHLGNVTRQRGRAEMCIQPITRLHLSVLWTDVDMAGDPLKPSIFSVLYRALFFIHLSIWNTSLRSYEPAQQCLLKTFDLSRFVASWGTITRRWSSLYVYSFYGNVIMLYNNGLLFSLHWAE